MLSEIFQLVKDANPQRNPANLQRRVLKLVEELGEVAQAWLNVTSASNGKQKTWDDVREEIADCLIVALDIAWTPMLGELDVTVTDNTILQYVVPYDHACIFNYYLIFKICLDLSTFARKVEYQLPGDRQSINRVVDLVSDMALCAMPDQPDATPAQIEAQLLAEVKRKLAKWTANRSTMRVVTDDV